MFFNFERFYITQYTKFRLFYSYLDTSTKSQSHQMGSCMGIELNRSTMLYSASRYLDKLVN